MIRFGILGCGKIARRHADLLGKAQIDNARLTAVCDLDEKRAKSFGANYGVRPFTSVESMMESGSVDAVTVLTPSGSHASDVVGLSPYGKPIIVEKPMALTLTDADRMIAACDVSGCKLFVVKQNRFNAPIVQLRNALDAGRFGKLILGTVRVRWCRRQSYYDEAPWRGTWANDGGVLANQASHHIDLLEWMMGDAEAVFGKARTALANIEAEDTAVVTIQFANGALGIIEATTATRPSDLEGSISILGEKGAVEVGGFAMNELKTWQFEDNLPGDEEIFEKHGTNPKHAYGYAHQLYYQDAVDCILSNRHHLVDGLAGRKSLELISGIYESIETGKEVALRFLPKRCRLGLPPKQGERN